MMRGELRKAASVLAGLTLVVGGATTSWARDGGFRRENIQVMRSQLREDKGQRREATQNFRAANQNVRATKADVNARIRSGEFGTNLTKRQKQHIRREALAPSRAERLQANLEHKYANSLVGADTRVMGALKGQPYRRPDGHWEKVAPAASKSVRQNIHGWIKDDKGFVKTDRTYVHNDRQALKAAKRGGDKQAVAEARRQLNQDRLIIRRDRAIRSVHQDQLKGAQGYRYIEKKEGGGLLGAAKGFFRDTSRGKPPSPPRP